MGRGHQYRWFAPGIFGAMAPETHIGGASASGGGSGGHTHLEGIELCDLNNKNEKYKLTCDGLFLAIGHTPNTEFLKDSGLKCDDNGYLLVNNGTSQTNIDGVYACGNVQDTRYKQAITAAGSGCMAAMDAEKYLESVHQQLKWIYIYTIIRSTLCCVRTCVCWFGAWLFYVVCRMQMQNWY